MPKPLSKRVRVRHVTTGAEKDVLRSQLRSLGRHWERVPVTERIRRRPAPKPAEVPAQQEPATAADKED